MRSTVANLEKVRVPENEAKPSGWIIFLAAELRRTWRQIPERETVGFEDRIPMERLIGGSAEAHSLMALLNLTMRGRVYFWQRRR